MARTSNRRQRAAAQSVPQEQIAKVYETAIYVRLSREDNLNNSDSIENQTALLESYIANEALKEIMYDAVDRVLVTDNQTIEIVWKFDDLFATA